MFSQEDSRGFDLINHAIRMGSAEDASRLQLGNSPSSAFATPHQHQNPVSAPHSGLVQSSNSFQFPWKLHDMLEQAQNDGLQEIVSWQDEGRSFKVYKPTIFVERLMPIYFKQTKYKSFQRQLNLYGFTRINEGPGKGGYKHKYFLKNNKALCQYISRQSNEETVPCAIATMHGAANASPLRIQAIVPENSSSHIDLPPDTVSPDSSTTGANPEASVDSSEKKEINEQYKALTQKDYQFPWKLHEMLEKSCVDNYDHIVSWQPGDYCFKVHDPTNFVTTVMPRFFKQTKYKSFQRQLNLYGFSRIDQGPNRGSYRHKLFLKGRKDLLSSMNRQKYSQSEARSQLMPQEVETRSIVIDRTLVQQHLGLDNSLLCKSSSQGSVNEPKCIDCGIPEPLASIEEDGEIASNEIKPEDKPATKVGGLNWRDPPTESYSDWIIVVLHNDTFDKESFHVHRRALAVGDRRSDYFARLFKSNTANPSNEAVLVLGAAEAAVFAEVLDFIYSDTKPKLNMQKAFTIFNLAEQLEIPALRQLTIDFYTKSLTKDNVSVLLQVFPKFGDKTLIDTAVQLYAQSMKSLEVTEAGRLVPNLLLQVLYEIKYLNTENNPYHTSRLVAECVNTHFDKLTQDLFRQLTDQMVIPRVDSLAAIKLLATENRIVKQSLTFVPNQSLHERCVLSITKNWNTIRNDLESNQNLAEEFKSISSDVLYQILMATTTSKKIPENIEVTME